MVNIGWRDLTPQQISQAFEQTDEQQLQQIAEQYWWPQQMRDDLTQALKDRGVGDDEIKPITQTIDRKFWLWEQQQTQDSPVDFSQFDFGYWVQDYETRDRQIAEQLWDRDIWEFETPFRQTIQQQAPDVTDTDIQTTMDRIRGKQQQLGQHEPTPEPETTPDVDTQTDGGADISRIERAIDAADHQQIQKIGEQYWGVWQMAHQVKERLQEQWVWESEADRIRQKLINRSVETEEPEEFEPSQEAPELETPWEEMFDVDTGFDATEQVVDRLEESFGRITDNLETTQNQIFENIQAIEWAWEEMKQNIQDISGQRIQEAEQNFNNLRSDYQNLKQQVMENFNRNIEARTWARADQLAQQWLLTDEQAAQAAQLTQNQFRDRLEEKRWEIQQEMAEWIINARREKNQLIDNIRQQEASDEASVFEMEQNVRNMYNNVLQNYQQWLAEVENMTVSNIVKQMQPALEMETTREMAEIEQEMQQLITPERLQRAQQGLPQLTSFIADGLNRMWFWQFQNVALDVTEGMTDAQAQQANPQDLLRQAATRAYEQAQAQQQAEVDPMQQMMQLFWSDEQQEQQQFMPWSGEQQEQQQQAEVGPMQQAWQLLTPRSGEQ